MLYRRLESSLRNRLTVFTLLICFAASVTAQDASNVYTQSPEVATAQVLGAPAAPKEKPKQPPKDDLLKTGPNAEWIWGAKGGDHFVFHKEFEGGSKSASLIATCDNEMIVIINDEVATRGKTWEVPVIADVQEFLKSGKNTIRVVATNSGGPAGLALKLGLEMPDGSRKYVVTDKTWKAGRDRKSEATEEVASLGKMGVGPWGNVFLAPKLAAIAGGAPRNVFNLLPGFQVERLFTVPKGELGSWVCITFDNKGRLIASDQGGKGLCRITPPKMKGDETKVERLNVKMTGCQGMLYAFGSLYCSVNGGIGSGFYKVSDTDNDDQFDEVKLLKRFQGGGEHGPHAVRLSPDGKSLYVIAGNHTNLPQGFNSSLVPQPWKEDLLLPRQWDARGHARGKLAPGGWICKTDPEGKTWQVVSIGYRNAYDMDFNADGELFAYDADMEWDMGTPWYRPTRVVHATSGSEFGWRSGTGKWPTYFPDSLPQLVDVGPGSPVGAGFGYGAKFPAKYQKALFILDWTFGTIYAIHIEPNGSSYKATKEEFVSRTPLPLTDVAIGPDGAMYFTVGGRGTQSELFRVTYVGDAKTDPIDPKDTNPKTVELRNLRRQLEGLHAGGPNDGKALELILRNLGHEDRHIRYAARVALEHRSANLKSPMLKADDPTALINLVIALARQGDKAMQPNLLAALEGLDLAKLTESQKLELLRAYALTFIRMGRPDQATAARIAKLLDPLFPSESNPLNRELSRVLAYLNSPTVITKTLALMEQEHEPSKEDIAKLLARNPGYGGTIAKMLANQPEIEKIHYAYALRTMRFGWTLEQRKKYFNWFDKAMTRSGGASYQGFIKNIRTEALANVSEAEKKALAATAIAPPPKPSELPKPKGPGKAWTLEQLLDISQTKEAQSGRDFENGRRTFAASRCVVCHRFDGNGGATGPDLSNVAGRFSYADLAEAMVNPSKVISDQYASHNILTTDGKKITGRIVNDAGGKLTVLTDPEDATKVLELPKGNVEQLQVSKKSLMPDDLLKPLNKDEVLDLFAYLMSRGNPQDRVFQKAGGGP